MEVKMKRMLCVACMLVLLISLVSCSESPADVLLVYNGQLDDGYLNQETYISLGKSCSSYGFHLKTMRFDNALNPEIGLTNLLATDPGLVIFCGAEFENTALAFSRNYPLNNFAIIGANGDGDLDGVQDVQNLYSVMFKRQEAGFFSGIYAASLAPEKVCFVGNEEYLSYIEYEAGFTAGIKSIDQEIKISKYYRKGEKDDAVASASLKKICEGAQIIYTIDNSDYIYKLASQLGIPVIGAVWDYREGQDEGMIFCVKEDIGRTMSIMMDDYFNGRMKGGIRRFGCDEDAFTIIADKTSPDIEKTIELWKSMIISRIITVPSTRTEAARYISPLNY